MSIIDLTDGPVDLSGDTDVEDDDVQLPAAPQWVMPYGEYRPTYNELCESYEPEPVPPPHVGHDQRTDYYSRQYRRALQHNELKNTFESYAPKGPDYLDGPQRSTSEFTRHFFNRYTRPSTDNSVVPGSGSTAGSRTYFKRRGPPQGNYATFAQQNAGNFPGHDDKSGMKPYPPTVARWLRDRWAEIPPEVRASEWPQGEGEYNHVPESFAEYMYQPENRKRYKFNKKPTHHDVDLWYKFLSDRWSELSREEKNRFRPEEERGYLHE